jgi:hypothetical protein
MRTIHESGRGRLVGMPIHELHTNQRNAQLCRSISRGRGRNPDRGGARPYRRRSVLGGLAPPTSCILRWNIWLLCSLVRPLVATGLVAISSIASAEDLSTATALLPQGTFTTSEHSDEWKIRNALSAAPASITEHTTVIDWPTNPKDGMSHGRVIRQGTNGWTCMPDRPRRPQHNPMCVDETMMEWVMPLRNFRAVEFQVCSHTRGFRPKRQAGSATEVQAE